MKLTLTDDEISEIVAAAYPTPHSDAGTLRARLTRAFGERVNPYEMWRGSDISQLGFAAALFAAAAKVAAMYQTDPLTTVDGLTDTDFIMRISALRAALAAQGGDRGAV